MATKSEISMILPKGIFVNTPGVYSEVARLASVPPETAWEYWRIYTITNTKLQDPTARRLENFWWHVVGSDRRHLSGPLLAKIYEHISLGPTFVPLRGPSNRWEGSDESIINQCRSEGDIAPCKSMTMSNLDTHVKTIGASAQRPPPSHPILKKPSEPSKVPKPTARFASSTASENEPEKGDELPSSGSTITAETEIRAPIKSPVKKKSTTSSRKFVVSVGRKRPGLGRRNSSQLSMVPSDTGVKEGPPTSSARSPHTLPLVAETETTGSKGRTPSPPKPSSKAMGKRPAAPYTYPAKSSVESIKSKPNMERRDEPVSLAKSQKKPLHLKSEAPGDKALEQTQSVLLSPRTSQAGRLAHQHMDVSVTRNGADDKFREKHDSDDTNDLPGAEIRPRIIPTRSRSGLVRHERGFSQALTTGAAVSTTTVEAQGALIDQSGNCKPHPISAHASAPRFDGDMPPSRTILSAHWEPTPPSDAPPVPLGRTRSQLNIMLDRENERNARRGWARG